MIRLEKVKQAFKSAQRKIKALLPHFTWKKALIFLSFLLISFVFWMLQSMQEEYEIQVDIPISYKDMPPNMTFTQEPPSSITVRIRDKGSALLNYTFGQKKALVNVNVKEIASSGGVIHLTSKDIEAILMKQFVSTTNLLSFDPQQIEISYSKLLEKELPIHFEGDVRTAPGFLVSGEIKVTPPHVKVYAADVILDTLKAVGSVYTVIDEANKSINRKLKLQPIGGVTFTSDVVTVSIPIEEYTEKTFEIQVVSKNIPEGYTIRLFPSTVRITCNVPLSLYKDLSESAFAVETSVGDFNQNISGMIPVVLTRKPEWVDKVTLSQDSIEFLLEQKR